MDPPRCATCKNWEYAHLYTPEWLDLPHDDHLFAWGECSQFTNRWSPVMCGTCDADDEHPSIDTHFKFGCILYDAFGDRMDETLLWDDEDERIVVMSPATLKQCQLAARPYFGDVAIELRNDYPLGTILVTTRKALAFSEGPPPAELQQLMDRVAERMDQPHG